MGAIIVANFRLSVDVYGAGQKRRATLVARTRATGNWPSRTFQKMHSYRVTKHSHGSGNPHHAGKTGVRSSHHAQIRHHRLWRPGRL